MTKKKILILVILIATHSVILTAFASMRVLDGDEGFYLNATRMVGMGMTLYSDFFYTQLSMMPTAFGGLALDGWQSFWMLRSLAVTAGVLSVIFFFGIVRRMTEKPNIALIAAALYCFSGLIIAWHSAYKPLTFAHMLALGSFYFWLLYHNKKHWVWLLLSTIFLSLVVNHRAVYIVLVPLYMISFWKISDNKIKNMLMFFAVMIAGSIQNLVHLYLDPGRFIYNTFIFQLNRADSNTIGYIISNKLLTIFKTIIDPHLLIVFFLAGFSIWLLIKQKKIARVNDMVTKPEGMAIANLLLIAFIYFIPNPILRQYVEQYFGFALIVGALSYDYWANSIRSSLKAYQRNIVVSILCAIYCLSIIPYVGIYILGMRKTDYMYQLSEIRKITDKMLELGGPADTVLAEWTGYPFFTKQTSLAYTELLGFQYPLPLDHEGYMHYHLADYEYLKEKVEQKIPSLVVTVNRVPAAYAEALKVGYDSTFTSGNIAIHTRK